jgi:purine-binding chemotaxis protein CheW
MSELLKMVVFEVGGERMGLHLSAVIRVIPAVEITPLPKAPEVVLGVVNIQGCVVPVFNMHRRFHLPEREVGLDDHIILAQTVHGEVALLVEEVAGVVECAAAEVVESQRILPHLEYVEGVVKREDGLIFIHDLEKFLSLEEELSLEEALRS